MPWSPQSLELFKKVISGAVYDESAWEPIGAMGRGDRSDVPPWKRFLARWLHRVLGTRRWTLVRQCDYNPAAREMGEDWPILGYTMIGHRRLDNIRECLETIHRENVPGNLIETGVWKGGACMYMKAILSSQGDTRRTVFLADSFAGLPPPVNAADGADLSGNPYLAVSSEQVRLNFERFDLWDERVKFIKGWFKDTLATTPTGPLALLRLDGDLYESTRVTLEALYDRVSPGGYIIVDDYHSWPGCRRAVNEFIEARSLEISLIDIDANAVYWRKISDSGHTLSS